MTPYYTLPNGAVQGGACCHPGELERRLLAAGIELRSYAERYADLADVFESHLQGQE